jgi:L-glyceraldehyde 3-phosphate reductase
MTSPNVDHINFRRCGQSGILLPALSLGLWHNFGGDADAQTARDLVCASVDAGITHIDLANNYGPPPGSAEETFGRILKQDLSGLRDQLFISTKAGYLMWPGSYGNGGSRKYLLASLDQSLQRMGLDYVDLFYSHRYDPDTPLAETMSALATAVTSGKALYVGISNYPPDAMREAVELLAQWHIPCLIHQFRMNLFDRAQEEKIFPLLRELNMGGIAFSPLAQGLLTGRYLNGIPEDSRIATKGFLKESALNPPTMQAIRSLHDLAAECGQTLAQFALSWLLRRPEVTSVIIGVSRMEQLQDNLALLDKPALTDDVMAEADRICAVRDAALQG